MNNRLLQRTLLHPEPSERRTWWLALGWLLVAVCGLTIDVMDVDASQYASISMEMVQNGSWLEVKHRGSDYLDKPPLLFWLSALSFKLFGFANWSYKLPSFLAALAGVYAVYRFCLLYYSRSAARNAAFMLAFSVGLVLIINDVRTDTLLLGASACAAWMLATFMERGGARWWLGAFACIGLAMLAKGPIGLVAMVFAAGTHVLLRRDWKNLLRWQWLAGLGVVLVILAPMCWGLYHQFDLHPEKSVNGRTGVSGLYFFFWEQSFGRITGENVWKNDTPPWYFIHVYLWAFLPWCLLLYVALFQRLRALVAGRFKLPQGAEGFSIGGFVLTFAALSMSKYKLPHYVFITLPWAAVLTAAWLEKAFEHRRTAVVARVLLYIPAGVLLLGAGLLAYRVFPNPHLLATFLMTVLTVSALFQAYRERRSADARGLVQLGGTALLAAVFVLNCHFYPNLLTYQQTSMVPRWVEQSDLDIPMDKLATGRRHGHAFDFYTGHICPRLTSVDDINAYVREHGTIFLYADDEVRGELNAAGVPYREVARFNHFQVALLKPAFLTPETREKALIPVYLLEVSEK